MTLADKIAEHTTTVFLNTEHFAEPLVFASRAAADIAFNGVVDRAMLKTDNTDEANSELADAHLVVSAAVADSFQAAVPDFEQDGWITINGQRYSILGEVDRDDAMVTLALASRNVKTLRKVKPHGR